MSDCKPLILASGSEIRKQLLKKLISNFKIEPAHLNERDYPALNALELAKAKALSINQKFPDHWVIGADQICHLDGQVFHKPKTTENAINTLTQLNGETHELITAVTLANKNEIKWHWVETIKMQMKQLSTETIKNYVATDHPLHSCGAYYYEQHGKQLFVTVSHDLTAIQGLPLTPLKKALTHFKVITELPLN
tara:strand:+ start:402 stop:983 length:582 start_codon:yes stop_codon:yes gene_type:complete